MRIAATGDPHVGKSSPGALQPLLSQITTGADVLVLAGDITDYGTADEARNVVKDLSASVRIPIVAVLGNHDFEAGHRLISSRFSSTTGSASWMAGPAKCKASGLRA
jgi:3',5'-cyclic AMP phosphodiesterase CpdA